MEHFNKLTPAEAERLAWLAEECSEVIQAIAKIQRHGYESFDPTDPNHRGNRADLAREIIDVVHAVHLMINKGDFSNVYSTALIRELPLELNRIHMKYGHHQD